MKVSCRVALDLEILRFLTPESVAELSQVLDNTLAEHYHSDSCARLHHTAKLENNGVGGRDVAPLNSDLN